MLFLSKKLWMIALLTMLSSCDVWNQESHCESLVLKVKNESVQTYLDGWVSKNVISIPIVKEKLRTNPPFLPRNYAYDMDFDWSVLGYESQRAIIFIGPRSKFNADINDFKFKDVESIYFTESSRVGVLYDVGVKGIFGFGKDDEYVIGITENIAVMCLTRDR